MWLMLFMESSCSIARLEYFDCKDGAAAALDRCDKALKRQQDSKKVSPSPDRCRLCTSLHDYTNKLHKMSFCTSIVWWLKY